MNKSKEISALWSEIKPQIGELVRLCHEVESHAEDTADAYQRGYDQGQKDGIKDGKCEAWEVAKKIEILREAEMFEIFGEYDMFHIMRRYTASEAIEKLKAYEQEKEEQIQVGDEVNAPFGKAIVVNVDSVAEKIWLVYADGHGGFEYFKDAPTKTGRHFPEVAAVFAKMKETDNG